MENFIIFIELTSAVIERDIYKFASDNNSVVVKIRIKFNNINRRIIPLLILNNINENKLYNLINFLMRIINISFSTRLIVRNLIIKKL